MTALNGKTVDLIKLRDELTAAGIVVSALGTAGDDLFTYDEKGEAAPLPLRAAAVIAAHVPPGPSSEPTRDERLLAAVDQAKVAVKAGPFTKDQSDVLAAVFDGLGQAITGGSPLAARGQ